MKRAPFALAALIAACGGQTHETPKDSRLEGYKETDPQSVIEEIGSLPFKHVEWDYKLRGRSVRRMTLGSEHIFVETSDHHIIAVNRFTGTPSWEYVIPRNTTPDWEIIEAQGVGQEILRLEHELKLAEKEVALERNKTPINDERFKKIQELQRKRDDIREKITGAAINDNVYYVTEGELFCVTRRTGKELWWKRLEFVPNSQPFATRNRVFFVATEFSRIHSLRVDEKGHHELQFSLELERHNHLMTRPVYDHPLCYATADNGILYAWWVDRNREHYRFQIQEPFRAAPFIHRFKRMETIRDEKDRTKTKQVEREYKMLIIGGTDKAIYGLDADGGNILWKYHIPDVVKRQAQGKDETVYVRSEGGYLHAVEALPLHVEADGAVMGPVMFGRLRWQMPNAERFLLKTRTGVYIEGEGRRLIKLDEKTGKIYGQYQLDTLDFIFTNTMDEYWYCATADGHLFCLLEFREQDIFQPTDRSRIEEELKRRKAAEKPEQNQNQ